MVPLRKLLAAYGFSGNGYDLMGYARPSKPDVCDPNKSLHCLEIAACSINEQTSTDAIEDRRQVLAQKRKIRAVGLDRDDQ